MATTTVTAVPLVIRNATLTLSIDGTAISDYSAAVSQAKFTPNPTVDTFVGIGGARVNSVSDVAWTLDLSFPQDWETATSLSQYLITNAGKTATAVLTPKAGTSAKTATATVLLVPGGIGGTYGQRADESISLACNTAPVLA